MDREDLRDQVTDGPETLRCPLGPPGAYLIVERTEWPGKGKITAVFYDSQDADAGAVWAGGLAAGLGVPLQRPDTPQPAGEETGNTTGPEIRTVYGIQVDGDLVRATDGCWVDPDGTCEHDCPSWLLAVGVIRPRSGNHRRPR